MELITKQLENDHNLFFLGDLHDGSVLSYGNGWEEMVSVMHSKYDGCKNNYGVDGGDMFEAIMIDDKRYSPEMLTEPRPTKQVKEAIRKREPIKKQLLSILMGNHERKLWKYGDLTKDICHELGVPYGTYTQKLTITDKKGNLMYKVFETHGSRSITSAADDVKRRIANMELILKRQLRSKAGDCAVMIKHHAHKLLSCSPDHSLYLTDDGKEIQQHYTHWGQTEGYIHPDARWYGCAGSFLRLYGDGISGYAEIAEYDPVELGFLILKVRDRKIVELKPYYLS